MKLEAPTVQANRLRTLILEHLNLDPGQTTTLTVDWSAGESPTVRWNGVARITDDQLLELWLRSADTDD